MKFWIWLTISILIVSYSQAQTVQTENVLERQVVRITSSNQANASFTFARTPQQLQSNYQYKLIVENADGQARVAPTSQSCSSLSFLRRLICLAQLAVNQIYISVVRVQSAEISLNGQNYISDSNFNRTNNITEIYLTNLNLQNTLNVSINGYLFSFINISIVSYYSPNSDTNPPTLTHNLRTEYFSKSLPSSFSFNIYSNEPLAELLVNNSQATLDPTGNYYSYVMPVEQSGSITLNIIAKDLAGNIASLQYVTNFEVDAAVPIITATEAPVIITDTYLLTISITEENDTTTYLKINDEVVGPFIQKEFSYLLEFQPGEQKIIEITTRDSAENTISKILKIKYVTEPLIANIISPLPNTTVNSHTVNLVVSSNRPVNKVLANNIEYNLNSPSLSFTIPLQFFADNTYSIPITVTDVFGSSFSTQINFSIKTNSITAWNYLECPAE